MPHATKEDFKKPLALRQEDYPLPEYGEGVFVTIRSLSARDIIALQRKYGTQESTSNLSFIFDLLALSLIGEDGTPLYASGDEVADGLAVSLVKLRELGEKACEVSGLAGEDEKKNDGTRGVPV